MNIDNETIKRIEQLGERIGQMISNAFVESASHLLCDLLYREIMRHAADTAPHIAAWHPPLVISDIYFTPN